MRKDVEERRVSEHEIGFRKKIVAVANDEVPLDHPHRGLYLRKRPFENRGNFCARVVTSSDFRTSFRAVLHDDTRDPGAVLLKFIEARFMLDIQSDEQTRGEAHGQSEDVDD